MVPIPRKVQKLCPATEEGAISAINTEEGAPSGIVTEEVLCRYGYGERCK